MEKVRNWKEMYGYEVYVERMHGVEGVWGRWQFMKSDSKRRGSLFE